MADFKKADIKIIFEDGVLLVIDKPAGWVTTRENDKCVTSDVKYIEEWVKKFFPNDLPRNGIVHRLDKGTSGVLVVAKTKEGLINLKKQFKQRQTSKHYWAMAGGDLPVDGNIKVPIVRSKYAFGKFKV
jgi:23S rRNA-/tRNA-specific pseudouridylate synthase